MKGHAHHWERRHINDVEELARLGLSDRSIAIALSYYYAIEPPLSKHQVKSLRTRLSIPSEAGHNAHALLNEMPRGRRRALVA